MKNPRDEYYMQEAILEAGKAGNCGEVPVGAVIVGADDNIIARAHNLRETLADPTAHAEIIAIREAAEKRGTWRLNGATLYCTLEPCAMCAGAAVNARIKRIVYGTSDPKSGACESVLRLFELKELNHSVETTGGVLAEEGLKLLQDFFAKKRHGGN